MTDANGDNATATTPVTLDDMLDALNKMLLEGTDYAKCGRARSTNMKCACRLVYYCSKECQREDWADHKARCTYTKTRAIVHQIDPQEAFRGLPNHLVATHILRTEYFDDPADLARLPAVSRGMRGAVALTGLRFEEIDAFDAAQLGCLSAVERHQRRGRLERQQLPCDTAARVGNLEKLKEFRAKGCPWDDMTCFLAAGGGHFEVLQWARANGCPWSAQTCTHAARGGHVDVLQWARANGCPWDAETCSGAAWGGHLEVLQWARANGCQWDAETCSEAAEGRAPRCAAVGACERLPVGRVDARICENWGSFRVVKLGDSERLPS